FDHAEAHAAAPVHRHAGRLVDHEERRVFVHDREFRRFCLCFRLLRNPDGWNPHPVSGLQAVLGLDAPAVDPDLAAAEHAIDVAFGYPLEMAQQEIVDALRRRLLADLQGARPCLAQVIHFPVVSGGCFELRGTGTRSVSRTCNPPPAWPQPGLKHWLISLTGSSDTTRSARWPFRRPFLS